jgi:hypothetical protein
VLTAVTVSPVQLATGSSTSPYQAGYNHGCSDARISDPSERYINQPERGPSFHTNEFMRGYNAGYSACSGNNGGGGNGTSTFAEGQRDGKAEGFRDAINERPADNRCPSGQSNAYCIGYRLSYDIEYQVTKWLPRK